MNGLELRDISFSYPKSKKPVLEGLNVVFEEGRVSSIRGYSGAGKSTLLYLVAGLDVPRSGQILWNGEEVNQRDLGSYRRHTASMIAQSYLLFPGRTVMENVCYPLMLGGYKESEMRKEASTYLEMVHIDESLYDRLPGALSGGEQQRVAIARCLATHTPLIAADEPTGNLDEDNTVDVIQILKRLAHEENKTVIIVTHDRMVADNADVRFILSKGNIRPE
ncbi:MAG: ABC transporter ATP-binding protein [Lachnospiraceae bacterium]|nr:ABC transporter ATP-binding protein [Lachnospiraceae bacterium]